MEHKHTVFIVDGEIDNLIKEKSVLESHYKVFTLPSGEAMFQMMNQSKPDLILLDTNFPGDDGFDLLRKLKSKHETARIPVILLAQSRDNDRELKALELGAVDYISRPYAPALLRKRVEIHLLQDEQRRKLLEYGKILEKSVEEKMTAVLELESTILKTVAGLTESRDDTNSGHIERTKRYLRVFIDEIIGRFLYPEDVAGWDVALIVLSSQLHDVGKISIRDEILLKDGKLTEAEMREVKRHTILGGEIIQRIIDKSSDSKFLENAKIFAECHHERWDGLGYPYGLAGDEIPLQARIMSIVNVYDALVSERSYKKPFSHEDALELILLGKGTEFDPQLTTIFMEIADRILEESQRAASEQMERILL